MTGTSGWRERLGPLLPLVAAAFAAGALLRLVWPEDINYLGDQAWTFRHVQDARGIASWPALGMPSSRGVKNPGMSVWVFEVLAAVSGAATPPGLTRAVAVLGLLASAAALVIPLDLLREREDAKAWIWAIVLTTTNPIVVFLERNIWAQSVLPPFMIALVAGWLRRDRAAGAFAWGFFGALIGQIHMAGFFFAPALAAWTKLFADRDGASAAKARWLPWVAGSALGAAPAVPWLLYLVRERPPPSSSPWWLRFRLEFYQYFFSDPSGLAGEYVLGRDILDAMRYPLVGGSPTYLVAVAHVALAVASFAIASRALIHLFGAQRAFRDVVRGGGTDTGVLLSATLGGMGLLMTLPSIAIHRHYMLATFPLPYVWTARAALRRAGGEKWLVVLFVGGLVATFGMLSHVRATGENAEMGKTYATQLREGIPPEAAKPRSDEGSGPSER